MIADFHSHLIPGVDDGAQTDDESRQALRRMAEEGVSLVITTPHVDGSITTRPDEMRRRMAALDAAWDRLVRLAGDAVPSLELRRGAEVKLDTPEPDLEDERLRLGGTHFALVEFPHLMVPPGSARALFRLSSSGWIPVVAHPERYAGIERELDLVAEWRRVGGYTQVNHGSVLGRYGADARRVALELLRRGWVDYLSSDYHARGGLHIRAARQALDEMDGEEQSRLLTEANPERLARGEPPIPVPPLRMRRSFFGRVLERFGWRRNAGWG